jgi:ATP/ADP translocase
MVGRFAKFSLFRETKEAIALCKNKICVTRKVFRFLTRLSCSAKIGRLVLSGIGEMFFNKQGRDSMSHWGSEICDWEVKHWLFILWSSETVGSESVIQRWHGGSEVI